MTVGIKKKAEKEIKKLLVSVKKSLYFLIMEMERKGPVRGDWPNYSKLSNTKHHCHLKKGNPTYVAIWKVADKEIKLIGVIYAGTHEKAPY